MLKGILESFMSQTPVVVEKATDADFPFLADIHGESFNQKWTDGDLQKMGANENNTCLLIRTKGSAGKPPLAFIIVQAVADEAEIITLSTSKAHRRKGFAQYLVEETIRRLQADRVKSLFLEVDENNTSAVEMYKKLGFQQVGERVGYYASGLSDGNKPSNALVMRRDLG